MSKIRIAIVTAAAAVVVPAIAFAAHVTQCCGSIKCCLRHLGCC